MDITKKVPGYNITYGDYAAYRMRNKGPLGGVAYGPVLNVSNCANSDYTTFANGTPTGFDATGDGSVKHDAGTADEIAVTLGAEYSIMFDLALNSGTAPMVDFRTAPGSTSRSVEGNQLSTSGSNSITLTANLTTTVVLGFQNNSQVTDFEVTNLKVRKIL